MPITEDSFTGSRLHLDCIVDKFAERVRNLLKGRIVYIPIRRPSSRKSEVESLSSATCAKALSLPVIYIIYIRHRLCSPPQADLPEAYLKIGGKPCRRP